MRSSYGGPGSARSTWKPTLDPGKQAAAATVGGQRAGDKSASRGAGTTPQGNQVSQASESDEKKE